MKMKTPRPNLSVLTLSAWLLSAMLAPQVLGQTTYYWSNNLGTGSMNNANNWSTNPASQATPGSAPGTGTDLVFNINSLNATNQTAHMAAGNRSYLSMSFLSSGTTQINRGSADSADGNTLTIGAGGITVNGGAGAVTFGTTGDTAQKVNMRAGTSLNITNNSSSLLTFNRTWDSGAASGTSTLTLNGSGTGGTTFVGVISNGGAGSNLALTINTTGGVTTLQSANTFTGATTISSGVLLLDTGSALSNTASVSIGNGGVLRLRVSNAINSAAEITLNQGSAIQAVVTARTLANNLLVNGDFTLGGAPSDGQALTLNGTVNLGGAVRQIMLGNSATLGGVISNGGLTLNGGIVSRSLTLSANNTYTGATTVASGTLIIADGASLGASDITVDSGAVLQVAATGSISNSPSIIINGTLNNAGLLTIGNGNAIGGDGVISGSLHFASGANFIFDLNSSLTVDGANVTFADFSIANLVGVDWASLQLNSPYTLIDGMADINFANVNNLGFDERISVGGDRFAYFQQGSLQLMVVAIPEPGSLSLLAMATGIGLLALRRKKA